MKEVQIMSTRPKIIVVGAGIVGASIAWHLARRGAKVILVDKGEPANGATGKSFGWIIESYTYSNACSQLRLLAIAEYRRLEQEFGQAFQVNWCGALTWHSSPAETERFARECAQTGSNIRLVERAEIATLEPNLNELPDLAAYAEDEGAIDATVLTHALVRNAQQSGAEFLAVKEVTALTQDDSRVTGIQTSEGCIKADVVVLASGIDCNRLSKSAGLAVPVNSSPAILLHIGVNRPLVRGIISTPELEVRQQSERMLFAAEDYIDDSSENGPDAIAQRALAEIRKRFKGAETSTLEKVKVGVPARSRRRGSVSGIPLECRWYLFRGDALGYCVGGCRWAACMFGNNRRNARG